MVGQDSFNKLLVVMLSDRLFLLQIPTFDINKKQLADPIFKT